MQLISDHRFPARSVLNRLGLTFAPAALCAASLVLAVPAAHAQFGAAPTTQVHDPAALKPPPGARVAIVEFEDMECPDCANANPLLKEAAAKYNIPWVRHDFPLPFHAWSFQAAVNARWFDTKSKTLGDDYRDAVFANQPSIDQPRRAPRSSPTSSPRATASPCPSPSIRRASSPPEVKADYALGQRIGIEHTPTIWVVTDSHQRRALRRGRRPQQALPAHRPGPRRNPQPLARAALRRF